MSLELLLKESIATGLKRKSIHKISTWAEQYRVIKGVPWSFKKYPWLKEMHDSKASLNVGQKAAQMGFTETVLNVALAKIDLKNHDVLYLLPSTTPDASDFSSARFDPALEESEHLAQMFSDVRNVGHKRAGNANLYIRGSKSRSQLKSIPVSDIIMDEIEEFLAAHIPLALERTSGQEEKSIWMISTPTIDNLGINSYFNLTTQEHFMFKCPACGRMVELTFPDCLEITATAVTDPNIHKSFYKCITCNNKIKHIEKQEWLTLDTTEWVPQYSNRLDRGFHISQFYSPTISPGELAVSALKAETNPEDEQEFYNSKLGLTHVVEGARVTDELIQNCISSHRNDDPPIPGVVTMGIDVGKWIHYVIELWQVPTVLLSNDINVESNCKIIHFGKVKEFAELDILIKQYAVRSVVIDANPEKRAARDLALRFYGMVKMCYYTRGITGKTINVGHDPQEPSISVDRTAWLDTSLGRFHNNSIQIPLDTDLELKKHIKAPVRVFEKDKDGNPIGRYVKGASDEDHYAHARNYSEMALPFAFSTAQSQDMGNIL
jgi:hypothetical protein